MATPQHNLLIWKGDDWEKEFSIVGFAEDLTTCEIRAQIRDSYTDLELLTQITATAIDADTVKLQLLKANTVGLEPNTTPPRLPATGIETLEQKALPAKTPYVWDLQATTALGKTTTLLWGFVVVVTEVTLDSVSPIPPSIDPADPYPQYLTQAEGDARYSAIGTGGGGYRRSFTSVDLTASKIILNHSLSRPVVGVFISDDQGYSIEPYDSRILDSDRVELDLTGFTINGTWEALVL